MSHTTIVMIVMIVMIDSHRVITDMTVTHDHDHDRRDTDRRQTDVSQSLDTDRQWTHRQTVDRQTVVSQATTGQRDRHDDRTDTMSTVTRHSHVICSCLDRVITHRHINDIRINNIETTSTSMTFDNIVTSTTS